LEVIRYDFDLKCHRSTEYHLHGLGDLHSGTVHCCEEHFKAKVKKIQEDKYARWIGMGDLGEYIAPKDKRWDADVIAPWVDKGDIGYSLEQRIEKLLSPIKTQCIGLLKGNHEITYAQHNDGKVHEHVCDRLGVQNLQYSAFIDLAFARGSNRYVYRVVATHGSGGAITDSAKLIRLERWMNSFDARIFLHAHTHANINASVPTLAVNDAGRIVSRDKIGAMTGCWFSTYTQDVPPSYGEQKTFPPSAIGSPVFTIVPDHDFVSVQS